MAVALIASETIQQVLANLRPLERSVLFELLTVEVVFDDIFINFIFIVMCRTCI